MGFCFLARNTSSGCSATPSIWPATRPGSRPAVAAGMVRVLDRQAGGPQHRAPHAPVEAADAAAGRAEPPALEVGCGLDVGRHHVGLRHSRCQAPELLHLHPAPDRDVLATTMAEPCTAAAFAVADWPPSNWMMLASIQRLAKKPSSLAT